MYKSIYKNQFLFEKHGPYFSAYVALVIKHHKDEIGENTENHHIHPTCMTDGIKNNKYWNKVNLEFDMHRHAHFLLLKAFPDNSGIKYSYNQIMNRPCQRGENNWMYGRFGELAPSFGNTFTHTAESKALIGDAHRGKIASPETIAKYQESRRGQPAWNKGLTDIYTNDTIEKMSKSALAIPKKICPYCNNEFSPSMYARWHGDNCKQKEKN